MNVMVTGFSVWMRRLRNQTRITYAVVGLLAGAVVIFIGLGRQMPDSPSALHLSDCRFPCWIGIEPGRTTIGEAKGRIKETFGAGEFALTEGRTWIEIFEAQTGRKLFRTVFLSPKLKPVDKDTFDAFEIQAKVALGDAFAALGDPNAIALWGKGGGTFPALVYDAYRLIVTVDMSILDSSKCVRLTGQESVQTLTIFKTLSTTDFWAKPRQWKGFGYCYTWFYIYYQ